MISLFLSAVPEQIKDYWYLYDLALAAIIAVCIVILMLLRKRSDQVEAEKSIKTAKKILSSSINKAPQSRRFSLLKAKNVLNTAEYHYSRCVSEEEKYELIGRVSNIKLATEEVEDLIKRNINSPKEDYDKAIDSILKLLS
ncbi:MAG TPA: hypothetical protein PLS05_07100 [Clostridia bacterium]|jgi:hypothetical protein|nr:hypothetical protein [Clostridia bacterium]HOL61615.1 hypothetical protein [Clostridia bacterium]HPO54255.1 hypothetical protein [Clostridia bacterium]